MCAIGLSDYGKEFGAATEVFNSFQQFVKAHETAVFTFCFRMLSNTKLAEHAAARAFQDVAANFPRVSLLNVLALACRHCRKQLRQEYRPMKLATNDIQQIFGQLTIPEREVMALRYACKLDFSDIAVVLNTSSEAVRVTLRQGRWHVADMAQTTPGISHST